MEGLWPSHGLTNKSRKRPQLIAEQEPEAFPARLLTFLHRTPIILAWSE